MADRQWGFATRSSPHLAGFNTGVISFRNRSNDKKE